MLDMAILGQVPEGFSPSIPCQHLIEGIATLEVRIQPLAKLTKAFRRASLLCLERFCAGPYERVTWSGFDQVPVRILGGQG
jgi:hypothetical protein